jgi:NAD(P)-dependent dehydrogenase (short-subunit alcohol dehydrogenase family)
MTIRGPLATAVIMQPYHGTAAVVTGAASGIGRGIAHALARAGAAVVVAAIEREGAEAVRDELVAGGARALALRVDVTDPAAVEDMAEKAFAAFGPVRLLCNNAGVYVGGPLMDTSLSEMQWLMSVNLWGVVHGVRAFVPRFRAQGAPAHILNTGSVSGLFPTTGQGAYAASKYAVVGYSERLREELAEHGIGVSVLCPATVRTRIGQSRRNRPPSAGGPVDVKPPERPPGAPLPPSILDPDAVGELVLRGIAENRLYIHTHANWVDRYRARFERIAGDFTLLQGR